MSLSLLLHLNLSYHKNIPDMKLLLLIFATVFAVLSSSSCTAGTSEIRADLNKAEKMMDVAPDSSLAIIERLDESKIRSRRIRAEIALKYSIALDKNGIDVRNDSIIRPAVSYYSRKGNKEQKSATYYYTARIYENMGQMDTAMEWLCKAEDILENSSDHRLLALVYSSKGRIYYSFHEYEEAASNYRLSSECYIKSREVDRFAACKLRESSCLCMLNEYEKGLESLEHVERIKDSLSIKTLAKYYPLIINIYSNLYPDKVLMLMEEYFTSITNEKLIDHLTVSRIYIERGEAEKAIRFLEKHKKNRGEGPGYFYLSALAHEYLGQESEALAAYKDYIRQGGMIGESLITQDTRFIEERQDHLTRHEKAKERTTTLILSVTVTLLALFLAISIIISIRKQLAINRNERIILQTQMDALLQEREELARTHVNNEEGRRIISERLRIIDNFVFSNALQDSFFEKKASDTLKEILSDRERFIRQNRLIFNQSYPGFIEFLKSRKLTDTEIEHCCLYATGLNGKMITNFTNMKRHYHIGSDIRKKLGLNEHDTNISIYIKGLLKEYE